MSKKLSIEEKAQAYDRAIEIINDYYQKIKYSSLSNAAADREVLENAFPQLKEDEDERTRNGIIKSIMDLNTDWLELHGVTKKNALTWLEKQGEQKEIDYNEELKKCKDNPLYFFDKYVKVKFKEHKPIWSEEDKETFSYLEDIVDFCYRNQYVVDVQTCERVRQLVSRLKSLCFQSKLSEEDVKAFNRISAILLDASEVKNWWKEYRLIEKDEMEKLTNWLKSIKDRIQI